MILLAWNCRGLGNRRAVGELVDIVQAKDPAIMFLLETWLDREHMEWVRCQLKFHWCFTVSNDGRRGGLAMLWRDEDVVWVDSFSNYHIDVIVHGHTENAWRLTGFYGEPETSRRSEGWNMLRMLCSKPKLPWCVVGDFNELLEVSDKSGGVPRSHNLMQSFREVLDEGGFVDLRYTGPDFTWHGRRRGELVWERLDRGVANYKWLDRFPMGRVEHLHCFTSDYRPLLLNLDPNGESQRWKRKPFRFKVMWAADPRCSNTVARVWATHAVGTPMHIATVKLKKCKKCLKKWSRQHFGNVKKQIKDTKELLWQAEAKSVSDGNYQDMVTLKAELNKLYDKEEQMWHQRSRVQWLKSGDKNTKFFHGTAT